MRGLTKTILSMFSAVVMLTLFFTPLMATETAEAKGGIWNPGLFRPRIDGFMEAAPPGRISEWNHDSELLGVKLIAEDGSSHAASLRVKSIGTDFYFALDSEFGEQPHAFLVVDLDGDGQVDQMVASVGDYSTDFMFEQGEWVPADELGEVLGQAFTAPSKQSGHFITEMAHVGLPDDTDREEILWMMRMLDPETGKSFFYPPIPPLDCPVPDNPFDFWPPMDPDCFERFEWPLEIDLRELEILEVVSPKVDKIEVTQAIQTEFQEMPLVLGKDSMARVYVDPGTFSSEVTVTLYGSEIEEGVVYRADDFFVFTLPRVRTYLGSMTRTYVAPHNPQRENIDDSANFVLPTAWTQVERLGLYAEITAVRGIPVARDPVISVFYPGSIFRFEETHDMVVYVLSVNDNGNLPTAGNIASWTENMTNTYPMANPSYPQLPWTTLGLWTGTNNQLLADLTQIAMNIIFVILIQILFGWPVTFQFPDQIFGARAAGGGLSDPLWDGGDSWATFGGPTGTSREIIMSHEIQHNIGPDSAANGHYGRHIGGCTAEAGDPDWTALYPGNDFEIHDIGWTPALSNPETDQQALVPDDYPDFMSYCQNDDTAGVADGTRPTKWVSTYRWENLFDRLQNWQLNSPGLRGDDILSGMPTVRMIRGQANVTGDAYLRPTYQTPGLLPEGYVPSTATSAQYSYKVVVRGQGGTVMQTIYVDPTFVDAHGNPRDDFNFVYAVVDDGNITSIEFLDDQDNVLQTFASVDTPDVNFVSVPTPFVRGQASTVTWAGTAPNSPFMLYQLEYSPDNATWFPIGQPTFSESAQVDLSTYPGSLEGRLRVRATNGFDTVYSLSSPFPLSNQPPSLEIRGSDPKQSVRSRLSFQARVADPDTMDNDLDSVLWTLDGVGLGMGPTVSFTADAVGTHTLKAIYLDDRGASAEDTVEIEIVDRPFPTVEELEEFQNAIVEETGPEPFPWYLVILVIIVIMVILVAIYLRRR